MADGCNSAVVSSTETDVPPFKRRRKVGYYCAVAECNSKHADGFTLHQFPTDAETRRQWIKFVQTCRADFRPSFGTPNQNSRICSLHFTTDCYPRKIALAASFGLKAKMVLNHKPVPTVQKPHRLAPTTVTTVTCSSTVGVASVSTASSTVTQVTTAVTAPICSAIVAPKQCSSQRSLCQKGTPKGKVENCIVMKNTNRFSDTDNAIIEKFYKRALHLSTFTE